MKQSLSLQIRFCLRDSLQEYIKGNNERVFLHFIFHLHITLVHIMLNNSRSGSELVEREGSKRTRTKRLNIFVAISLTNTSIHAKIVNEDHRGLVWPKSKCKILASQQIAQKIEGHEYILQHALSFLLPPLPMMMKNQLAPHAHTVCHTQRQTQTNAMRREERKNTDTHSQFDIQ